MLPLAIGQRCRHLFQTLSNNQTVRAIGASLSPSPNSGTEVAMLSSMLQSSTIPVLEQVLNFTEARHGVLAGNIANVDTPGYKTRDLSPELFQQRLKEAIETRDVPYESQSTYNSSRPQNKLEALRHVADSLKGILRHDEVNVSIEGQVNEIVKNQQEHNLAVNIMVAQFRLLRAAVTERVA
jgi:flagellar basal-body rod protein FlgB